MSTIIRKLSHRSSQSLSPQRLSALYIVGSGSSENLCANQVQTINCRQFTSASNTFLLSRDLSKWSKVRGEESLLSKRIDISFYRSERNMSDFVESEAPPGHESTAKCISNEMNKKEKGENKNENTNKEDTTTTLKGSNDASSEDVTTANQDCNNNINNQQPAKKRKQNKWSWSEKKKAKKSNPNFSQEQKAKNNRKEGNENQNVIPNAGSYACESMRKLHGVSLPTLDDKQETKHGEDGEPFFEGSGKTKGGEENVNSNNEIGDGHDENIKFPKRKVALLIAFLGTNYVGMQMNTDQKTIQAEIELALFKAGLISKANFGFPSKTSWSNAARTDKGVHSCAQVCSAKLLLPTDDLDRIRELINEQLPDDIRIFDVVRTTRSFCAKTARDQVRYQYMLPSFLLQDRDLVKNLFREYGCNTNWTAREAISPLSEKQVYKLRTAFATFRATEKNIEDFQKSLSRFVGTNNFHNYTSGKKPNDPSSVRYIKSFSIQDSVIDQYGIEWIPTLVLGQSFLLHQIRKMISMAADVGRGALNMEAMDDSFSPDNQFRVNVAPAQGLFLDMSYYDGYNKRNKANDPLDWHSDETAAAVLRWKDFKEKKVMSHIMDEESQQGNFVRYLYNQEHHLGRTMKYLKSSYYTGKDDNTSMNGKCNAI